MKKKIKIGIWSFVIVGLLTAMTISDIYYSKMEEEYPILEQLSRLEGKVTGITIHHKYTYLELDSRTKVLVPPSFLKNENPTPLHEVIAIGDYFLHAPRSKEVMLRKHEKELTFLVSGLI